MIQDQFFQGAVPGSYGQQVFSKTEKWLTPAPVPDFEKWSGRESEIAGYADYVTVVQLGGTSFVGIQSGNSAIFQMEYFNRLGL